MTKKNDWIKRSLLSSSTMPPGTGLAKPHVHVHGPNCSHGHDHDDDEDDTTNPSGGCC